MAQDTTITLAPGVWALLTNSDTTALRAQMQSGDVLLLKAAVGAVAPTNTLGAIHLDPMSVLPADVTIASLWPGVAGANRVYGMIPSGGTVSVSHA